jgi:hypothetical protein
VRPVTEEEVLPEAEILPLDLEIELEEFELDAASELLTNP